MSSIGKAVALAAAVLALTAAPAPAVVTTTAEGPVSYLPLNQAAPHSAASVPASVPTGEPPLLYHGGPVMHSQTSYAIFWAPSGYPFPSGYTGAITSYLKDVAGDSGKASNVYSVSAQYTDGVGRAAYSDSYGGLVNDPHAFPTTGSCAPYTGAEVFTACVSDENLEAEVEAVAGEQGWPSGLGAEYYVVLPPHVGSCFGTACFDERFCAYHSYTLTNERIYANISYSPGDPFGCGVGEYPNGHANGNVDDTLSSLSHEANESITDPTLEAWYDEEGLENGDECRNTPSGEDYGPALGGSGGTLFNQAIGAGHYYLQQEWSNEVDDCVQRVEAATPLIADPGQVIDGQTVFFDGSASAPGATGIASYEWEFGDGTGASGVSPAHTYHAAGPVTVTLKVTDADEFIYMATRQLTVAPPPLPPLASIAPASGVGASVAILNGVLNPKARDTTYRFEYGPTTTYGSATPEVDAGAGVGDTAVAAPISGLAPATTYHYRLVARNSVAPTASADGTFTTAALPLIAHIEANPTPIAPRSPPTCRKGFKRKTVKGKVECVRTKGRHRKHHRR